MTFAEQRTRPPTSFLVGNAVFVLLEVLVAAWAAWPIYGTGSFLLLAGVATLLGAAIALAGLLRRWGWLTVAAVTLVVYLVVGVPLAVPSAFTGVMETLGGWLSLVTGTVFGWKQLATITTIPVGSYQALLVPALVVFLVGTVTALSIAWRSRRFGAFVVPVAVIMQGFGLVFGAVSVSTSTRVLFVTVAAPRELVIGVAAFFVSLGFLLWRVRFARRSAIRASQSVAGIGQYRQATASLLRRLALAVVVLVVAVAVAAGLSPALGSASARQVLRSAIDPDTHPELAESPLDDYREYFTPEHYDEDLVTVEPGALQGERLRLAVMSYYDGQHYRVVDPVTDGTADSAFVRVPYRLDPGVSGTSATATVTIDGYRGIWLPTVDHLEQLAFTGSNSAARADDFFYNRTTASAIDLGGLSTGDRYTLEATVPASMPTLAELQKPATPSVRVDASLIPANLVQWVRLQQTGSDAASLGDLIDRLRQRGYLSHSLLQPTATDASSWVVDTGIGDAFQPSYAGHSIDRIDALFGQLVQKQGEAAQGASDAELVAAVGDDEQFAVAAALLAQYEGFASRVVLGFDLDSADRSADDVPACTDVCKGKNLTAWIEVQGADGSWVAVDTSPQHTTPVDTTTSELKDPTKPTTVFPDSATEQQPPAADPAGGNTEQQPAETTAADLGWLVFTLKIVGLSLLAVVVLLAPFATILVAKARRRRERRRARAVEERIVGGWDEYIDTALDHGLPILTTETRSQVAETYQTPNGQALATLADQAVFGPFDPLRGDSERFWQLLERDRLAFDSAATRWQRLRAAVSLRSFTRYLGDRPSSNNR